MAQEYELPAPRLPLAVLLAALFFVSPLVFFTDLTRNPYYLQITLLNCSVLLAWALIAWRLRRGGGALLPATPLNRPLAALLLVYAASFAWSYFGHAAFFRPAILSEGLRAWLFVAVNCVLVYYLAALLPWADGRGDDVPAGRWLAFVAGWGLLWVLYPWMKAPPGGGVLARMFDPYGTLVWGAGFTAVYLLIRRCRQEDILHLAMATGAVASLYGVLEYFHVEFIWAKLVNPYGNRSVSTFGNPNFISSYVLMLLPLAAWRLLRAPSAAARWFYGLCFLSYEGMLMASLTRSSWAGAGLALALLGAFVAWRRPGELKLPRPFLAAALVLLVAWPAPTLKPFSSGLFDRLGEAGASMGGSPSLGLSGTEGKVYGSFHQRLLIWTSVWQMGLENPLLGKGWGQLELFYPFYQGRLLLAYPEVRNLRTHANNAHNEVLEQWGQAGLLGLGIFAWLLLTLFYAAWRFCRDAAPAAGGEAAAIAAGLGGMLADNLLNVSLHFAVPGLLFWWLAGALMRRTAPPGAPAAPRPLRVPAPAAWLLIALSLCGVRYWYGQFNRELLYFSGFKAMRQGNFAAAAAQLKLAWQAHPREVNSNYEMGNAYVRTGDPEKGAWAYLEALKSNAGYDEIYFNLAIVCKKLGRLPEALEYLRVSAFINPLNQLTWQALGEIYLSAPDRRALAHKAAQDFAEAARAFPYDGNYWNNLGYFHTLLDDFKSARDAYASGVKADPASDMLAGNLAGAARRLGPGEDPALAWLRRYRGLEARLLQGRAGDDGLREAEALLAADPGSARARGLLAKFYFKAGRYEEAGRMLRETLQLFPSDNSARYGLAVILEKKGDRRGAAAEWARFLEHEPQNAAVRARMQGLLAAGGDNL